MTQQPAIVRPAGLPAPVGFSHGVLAGEGRPLYLAGQIGSDADGRIGAPGDMLTQIDRALGNLLAVVAAAGGPPESVVKLVIYVTDVEAYRRCRGDLGPIWRSHFGRYYPAMTLVAVAGLFEPDAVVEIEGVAIVAGDPARAP